MKKYFYLVYIFVFFLHCKIIYAENTAICFLNDTGRDLQVNYPTYATGAGPEREAYLKTFPNQTANVSFRMKRESTIPESNEVYIHGNRSNGSIPIGNGINVVFIFIHLYIDPNVGSPNSLRYAIDYNENACATFKKYCPQLKAQKPSWWPNNCNQSVGH